MQSELSSAIELIISYAHFKIYHCSFHLYGLYHPVSTRGTDIVRLTFQTFVTYISVAHHFSLQILSESFLKSYGKDIINIHHGLLPSFKGGHPSRQVSKLSDFICEANMKC